MVLENTEQEYNNMMSLIHRYEMVETWCISVEDDPILSKIFLKFKDKLRHFGINLENRSEAKLILFIFAHIHTSLCLEIIHSIMEYEQEFPAKLLELARICTLYNYNKNKNYHPSLGNTQGKSYIKFMEAEASIILCRLLRLSAANIIEQMFSNSVRKRVLNALIF